MRKVTVINRFTNNEKSFNVPNAVAEAFTVGGLCAVMGTVVGAVVGLFTDVKDLIKNRKK